MKYCNYNVSFRFGVLYTLMNLFFMYMIVMKLIRKVKGGNKKKVKDEE